MRRFNMIYVMAALILLSFGASGLQANIVVKSAATLLLNSDESVVVTSPTQPFYVASEIIAQVNPVQQKFAHVYFPQATELTDYYNLLMSGAAVSLRGDVMRILFRYEDYILEIFFSLLFISALSIHARRIIKKYRRQWRRSQRRNEYRSVAMKRIREEIVSSQVSFNFFDSGQTSK